jgi:hypothetical protein
MTGVAGQYIDLSRCATPTPGAYVADRAMWFKVRGKFWGVFIAADQIWRQGVPCLGWIDFRHQLILIDAQSAFRRRRVTLFHELRHAWVGLRKPWRTDIEVDASSVACWAGQVLPQYAAQGGDETLRSLRPSRYVKML